MVGRRQRTFDGPSYRQVMSAVKGNDDEEATRDKCDADGDCLAASPTGSGSMPANCVVCVVFDFYFVKMITIHER